jgi:hypothetical protein
MSEIVKASCPYYQYKPKEGIVSTCDGDVEFIAGNDYGTCKSCGREIPLIVEV